ncbi:MAG: enoyl-CoA hydratase [Gammaproteobacteria bacterium]|nr:enoyl-CoA hydratase [Gammaproteobacteria bacterium]MCP5418272.1 enoyl-CoA hydratase [Chromatiaceae bacterium]
MNTAITENEEEILLREDADGVVTLTLNRPAQYNGLSEEMLAKLSQQLTQIADDSSVHCVVLAARGKAFCAGHDLKQMRANPDKDYYQSLFSDCGRMMRKIVELPVPVIARVQGIATAAGCQLVASCDLAVAADSATFAVSGINLGLFCSTPAVALSRNVSRKRAFEMLFTGKFIDSETAVEWGLINRAVPVDRLDGAVKELTDSICAKSRVPVRVGKEMFYHQLGMELDEAYAFAAEKMACNMMSEDACEGIDSFIERRKPTWKGC